MTIEERIAELEIKVSTLSHAITDLQHWTYEQADDPLAHLFDGPDVADTNEGEPTGLKIQRPGSPDKNRHPRDSYVEKYVKPYE